MISDPDRQNAVELIEEARASGARRESACECGRANVLLPSDSAQQRPDGR